MIDQLKPTTAQRIRSFLDGIGAYPSPTMTTDEVVALLKEKLREHKDKQWAKRAFRQLIDELRSHHQRIDDELPHFADNYNSRELADELKELIGDDHEGVITGAAAYWTIIALSSLLLWVMTPASCSYRENRKDGFPAEIDSIEESRFIELSERSDELSFLDIRAYNRRYKDLTESQKESVIAGICSMPARDIAEFLETRFADENSYTPENMFSADIGKSASSVDDDTTYNSDDDLYGDDDFDDDSFIDDDIVVDDDTVADDDTITDDDTIINDDTLNDDMYGGPYVDDDETPPGDDDDAQDDDASDGAQKDDQDDSDDACGC